MQRSHFPEISPDRMSNLKIIILTFVSIFEFVLHIKHFLNLCQTLLNRMLLSVQCNLSKQTYQVHTWETCFWTEIINCILLVNCGGFQDKKLYNNRENFEFYDCQYKIHFTYKFWLVPSIMGESYLVLKNPLALSFVQI